MVETEVRQNIPNRKAWKETGIKFTALENLSTTLKMAVLPLDRGGPITKS